MPNFGAASGFETPQQGKRPEGLQSYEQPSPKETADLISGIMQEVYMMGANDSEIPELMQLMNDCLRENCTPDEAEKNLETARKIKNRKSDYH